MRGRSDRRPRWRAIRALVLLVAMAGPAMGATAEKPESGGGASLRDQLISLHEPPRLSEFERRVRVQYDRRRAPLDRALADPGTSRADLADAFGELGMWAQAYRFDVTAERSYQNARTLAPDDPRWAYYLGRHYRKSGDTVQAREAFERVLVLEPGDVPARVFLGEIALEAGELGEAERQFQLALDRDPECVRALWGVGRVAIQLGENARAIPPLERAVARLGNEPPLHYSLGLAYRGVGELDLAQKQLEIGTTRPEPGPKAAMMEDPRWRIVQRLRLSSKKHQQRARLALNAGRHDDAIKAYRRAVQTSPDNAGLRINMGSALLSAGRNEAAIAAYRRALELDPSQATAHFNLGLALQRVGRADEALMHLGEALALDPGYARAQAAIGAALAARGEAQKALFHLDRAVKLDPGNEDFRLLRADLLVASGDHAGAARAIAEDLRNLPDSEMLPLLQARLLASAADAGLRDGARSLEIARGAFPEESSLAGVETMAMAHAELGDFESAVVWQRAAVAAAERAGRPEALAWARERLALYEQGKPCRDPWHPGESSVESIEVTPPAG